MLDVFFGVEDFLGLGEDGGVNGSCHVDGVVNNPGRFKSVDIEEIYFQ